MLTVLYITKVCQHQNQNSLPMKSLIKPGKQLKLHNNITIYHPQDPKDAFIKVWPLK